MFKRIIKDWTLPISMVIGFISYFVFSRCESLAPVKPYLVAFIPYLLPSLIFLMLFLSYVKINPRDLLPKRYHLWLILIQLLFTSFITLLIIKNRQSEWVPFMEAMLACVIAPMAAVGAVVTAKIGGNASTATTYTIISSLYTAIMVPIVYPIVEPGIGVSFVELFLKILSRVFPTIVVPLLIALFLRAFIPKLHRYCEREAKDKSFYLWALCTAVNTAQIIRIISNSPGTAMMVVYIILGAGILCAFQFLLGKNIGRVYGDRISGGQSLGQKNTVLSIWIAMTFLSPEAAIAPGAYLLWQNIINSYQIWKYDKISNSK